MAPVGRYKQQQAPPLNVNDKSTFDPFAVPKTTGAFNQQVLNSAAPSYTPAINQNNADVQAENQANKTRVGSINSVYNQYGTQAKSAFKATQDALNAMISANAGGDSQSQSVLNAALKSASAPGNSLASMLGLSGPVAGSDISAYQSAAQGAAAGTGNELKGLGAGLLSTAGQEVSAVPMERTAQRNTESQRHQAELQSLRQTRQTVLDTIPAAVEKAREQLIQDIMNAHSLQFQEALANKQFSLTKSKTLADIAVNQQNANTNTTNANTNKTLAGAKIRQGQQQIDMQRQQIRDAAATIKQKYQDALAKAQGAQEANAVKFLTGWAQPTSQELTTTHSTNAQGQSITSKSVDPTKWHRDAGNALKTLMTTYGLPLENALALMSGLTTPIGGRWNMTVGQWASSYLQRQQQQRAAQGNPYDAGIMGVINRLKGIFGV